MIATADPHVFIEEQRPGYVRYQRDDGRRWEQFGTCGWSDPTTWGPCGQGSSDLPPGPPQGRLDIPNTPGLECSLCVAGGFLSFRAL